MDGVLVDTGPIHERAFREVLVDAGVKGEFNYSAFAGIKTYDVFASFFSEQGFTKNDIFLQTISKEKSKISLNLIKNSNVIYDGVLEMLEMLKKRSIVLALASSASKATVDIIKNKYNLDNFFDLFLSSSDVAMAKPHPEIFLKCLTSFNVDPSQALVVEDSIAGIMAAKHADIETLAIATTVGHEELLLKSPSAILGSIKELIQYL